MVASEQFSSLPNPGLISAGQTAFLVKCGLGHVMDEIAPTHYLCRDCGFSVFVTPSDKT